MSTKASNENKTMINLLKSDYINAFSLTGKDYTVEHSEYKGKVAFADPKSCRECVSKVCSDTNREQVFVVESKDVITVVEIEKYFNQFRSERAKPRKRCDLMLYSLDKIAFVELYCGQQQFLTPYQNTKGEQPGKIARARQQISCTIDKLTEVETIKNRIHTFKECIGLFAYRKKYDIVNGAEEQSMVDFMEMSENIASDPQSYTVLSNGVPFHTVTYPTIFQWT